LARNTLKPLRGALICRTQTSSRRAAAAARRSILGAELGTQGVITIP